MSIGDQLQSAAFFSVHIDTLPELVFSEAKGGDLEIQWELAQGRDPRGKHIKKWVQKPDAKKEGYEITLARPASPDGAFEDWFMQVKERGLKAPFTAVIKGLDPSGAEISSTTYYGVVPAKDSVDGFKTDGSLSTEKITLKYIEKKKG